MVQSNTSTNSDASEHEDETVKKQFGNPDTPTDVFVKRRAKAPLEFYTAEEVKKHNTRDDCWVIVDGKVYNVTDWISRHPGGELLITSVAGVDISDAFLVNHMPWVREKMLPVFQIGYVKDYKTSQLSKDFVELALTLEKTGWYETSYVYYAQMVVWYAFLFTSSVYCVLTGTNFFVRCILSATLMALFWQQLAFAGHDLGHMAVTHDRVTDNLLGVCGGNMFMGIAIGWWKATHNVHHLVTNYLEYDPDIQHLPVIAITEKVFNGIYSYYHGRRFEFDAIAQFFVSHQHYLFYPVMFVARFNLYIQSILLLIHPKSANARGVWYPRLELAMLGLFYVWLTALVLQLPSFFEMVVFVILSHGMAGVLHVQICISHFSMEVMEVKDHGMPLEKMEFMRQQMRTCLDVDCDPAIDWFHGGLQFQAPHHLFPMMPRNKLRESMPYVETLCKKHDLQYHKLSFFDANATVVGTLEKTAGKIHPWFKALLNAQG